jgi:hypothetical protein
MEGPALQPPVGPAQQPLNSSFIANAHAPSRSPGSMATTTNANSSLRAPRTASHTSSHRYSPYGHPPSSHGHTPAPRMYSPPPHRHSPSPYTHPPSPYSRYTSSHGHPSSSYAHPHPSIAPPPSPPIPNAEEKQREMIDASISRALIVIESVHEQTGDIMKALAMVRETMFTSAKFKAQHALESSSNSQSIMPPPRPNMALPIQTLLSSSNIEHATPAALAIQSAQPRPSSNTGRNASRETMDSASECGDT